MMAFTCKYETQQFSVVPFGLMNVPNVFQHMTCHVLRDLDFIEEYSEDVFVGSESIEEHVKYLRTVVAKLARLSSR